MADSIYAVIRVPGPAWDKSLAMRAQADWDHHACFMDDLAASGFVIMGGPLTDSQEILLVIAAENEPAVRQALQRDPWEPARILTTQSVRPWMVLLDSRKPS